MCFIRYTDHFLPYGIHVILLLIGLKITFWKQRCLLNNQTLFQALSWSILHLPTLTFTFPLKHLLHILWGKGIQPLFHLNSYDHEWPIALLVTQAVHFLASCMETPPFTLLTCFSISSHTSPFISSNLQEPYPDALTCSMPPPLCCMMASHYV